MTKLDKFFEANCYSLPAAKKHELMLEELLKLDASHYEKCQSYKSIIDAYPTKNSEQANRLEDIPFLPVRLFKELELKSVEDNQVFKTLLSSGTTGQTPSRIYLDSITAKLQTKTLVKIVQTFIGKDRIPMLIIDHPSVVKDRTKFSARGAGILGLYNFGRQHCFALEDESMEIAMNAIEDFVAQHSGKPILIFGFTFMVWKYFILELERANRKIDLSSACLIHSGGWKKLVDEAVDNKTFKKRLNAVTGITKVHNFYGMVEQVGSIFMECEEGFLHAPVFSDVLVRNPLDWSINNYGESGVIQVLSVLPQSYPGHSLLTEDRGVIIGEDDCACGRKGKYFEVLGRLPKSETRGCSDTHEQVAAG